MKFIVNALIFLSLFFILVTPAFALPAFPEAEGFGANALGGRGDGTQTPQVFIVNNLNDSGPGSLRNCVEAEGPRFCVFAVGGTIRLNDTLKVRNPYITIAGQSAPGGGITLRDGMFEIKETHDVVVRYIRVRLGDQYPGCNSSERVSKDAVWVQKSQNVILDHVSAGWGTDEVLSVTEDRTDNITVQWSIISEALNCSCHEKGCHGFGSIMGGHIEKAPDDGNPSLSFHHNLFAHNVRRNPKLAAEQESDVLICNHLDLRNNVIYNWEEHGTHTGKGQCTRSNIVGNYYKSGPSVDHEIPIDMHEYSAAKAYANGNYWFGHPGTVDDNWAMISGDDDRHKVDSPYQFAPVTTTDAQTAYQQVLAQSGTSLPVRDSVDQRIVNDVENRTGAIINSPSQVGGWPQLSAGTPPQDSDSDGMPDEWEEEYGLGVDNPNDSVIDSDGDGYLNIEEYLNSTEPKAPVVQCLVCSTGLPKSQGNADCNNKIDLLDFASWLKVFKSGSSDGEVDFDCSESDTEHTVDLADFRVWVDNFIAKF